MLPVIVLYLLYAIDINKSYYNKHLKYVFDFEAIACKTCNLYEYSVSSNFKIMCQKFLACFVIRIVIVVLSTTSYQDFLTGL